VKFLIFGLGNIGEQYAHTRHNIGFDVLDQLAGELECQFSLQKLGMTAEGKIKNKQMLLVKPTTFMNLSGKTVQYYMQLHKTPPENILVVTDDLALDLGVLRMRIKGSHGGHNGLRNIEETLQSQQYPRLRFGIGDQFDRHRQIDFVLGKWSVDEQAIVSEKIRTASEAIKSYVLEGAGQAMTKYNG
jgi:PTH1 family peptidyl-tRNA hydrolase